MASQNPAQRAARIETDPYLLKPCDNPLCDRKTTKGVLYCCGACGSARTGGYEIHEAGPLGHSPSCNERHAVRGGAR